jgi:hypothetical protein
MVDQDRVDTPNLAHLIAVSASEALRARMGASVATEGSAPSSPRRVVAPDGETRTVSDRTALRVWVAAGGRCTMCNRHLVDDGYTSADVSVGQLAHIVGWSKASGSPRGANGASSSSLAARTTPATRALEQVWPVK